MQQQFEDIAPTPVAGPPEARGGSPSTQLVLQVADAAAAGMSEALREGQEVLARLSIASGKTDTTIMADETGHMKRTAEEQKETDQSAQTTLAVNTRLTRSSKNAKRNRR